MDDVFDQPLANIKPPKATQKQLNYIGSLIDDLGWHSEYLAEWAAKRKVDLADLDIVTAAQLITALAEEAQREYKPKWGLNRP